MRRVLKLTAFAVGVLTIGAARAAAAPGDPPEAAAAVTAISVVPGAGRADVVVAFNGAVEVKDFVLQNPRRIVVDLRGATMRTSAPLYDRIARAGITNVRMAQFSPEVVRLVLDLDGPRQYSIARGENELRVSVIGPDAFAPWSSGATAVAAQPPPSAAMVAQTPPSENTEMIPARSVVGVERAGRATTPRKFQSVPQQSVEPPITVSFFATDIHEVIALFASVGKRTILTGSTVAGKVTAEITNQPWDVALARILQMQGLSAIEDSTTGIINIDSYTNLAARVAAEPLVTQLVAINYAKATELAVTIRQLIAACSSGAADAGTGSGAAGDAAGAAAAQSGAAAPAAPAAANPAPRPQTCGRGTVASDDKTNTLIVTESASRLPEIVSYVKDLDVRTPQVAIKAKIISVDRTATEELGVSYDLGSANGFTNALVPRFQGDGNTIVPGEFRVNLAGDAFAGVANANRNFSGTSALSLIFNTALGGFNLTSFLDALSSEQLSDVQAEPSTTTVDNREATLFAGTEIAFLLTPPSIPGQLQAVAPVIQRQKVGITLKVTPHVTANRQISMLIEATQQSLLGITVAGPSINERNSKNEVLVADGETAVIAGLTQTQVSKTKTGIPILMHLPLIGRLFSETRVEERKQDLLILVTPHIIDEGEVVRSPIKP